MRIRRDSVEPPGVAALEATTTHEPVIFVAGYESIYGGEPSGYTPPIIRFSYSGLYPDGRPRPYPPIATHQSLVTSAHLLAEQIDRVHRTTGRPVALVSQSEVPWSPATTWPPCHGRRWTRLPC